MEWKKQEILSSKVITKSRNWEEDIDNLSPITASVGSGEPFIGLKLGKRTYFEANSKTSSSSSSFSGSTTKKAKLGCQSTAVPRCQVEGCNLDLSSSKEYHRKHRVCETHSKYPKVVVGGVERRFCQQCSRFHSLSEFDEKKRSCRRRLSDHNARRRKLQHDFNSTNLTSSFYVNMKADESSLVLDDSVSLSPNMPTIAFNTSKHTRVEVLDQGLKESFSPNVDALRALSLLSNNYNYSYSYGYNPWGLNDPELIALDHHQPPTTIIQQGMQSVPHLSSPDYSQTDIHAKTPFQEFQLFNRFYSNPNPMDDF